MHSGGPGDLARLSIAAGRHGDDVVVASIAGEVDQSNASALLGALASAVPNSATGLVIDCTDLMYIDSAGVYLLFTLAKRLGAHQQRLAVAVAAGSHVEQVVHLTHLQQLVGVFATRDEAVESLAGAS